MYIVYRFVFEKFYWDIYNKDFNVYLKKNRNKFSFNLSFYVKQRDIVLFRFDVWLKMGFYMEYYFILFSEEVLVLQSRVVYVLIKIKYRFFKFIFFNGRVQFLNRKNKDVVLNEIGLSIFLRFIVYIDFDKILGIQCFLGFDGQMKISLSYLSIEFYKSMRFILGSAFCFRFLVVDTGIEIIFEVVIFYDCYILESVMFMNQVKVELRLKVFNIVGNEMNSFIVKLEDSNRVVVFDEFYVKYGSFL